MVKKRVERELTFCDQCDAGSAYYKCRGCDRDYCYDCAHTMMTVYPLEVNGGDSMQALRYCPDCEAKLPELPADPLLQACLKVKQLHREQKGFWEDFKVRKDAAEAEVRKELEKCKQ